MARDLRSAPPELAFFRVLTDDLAVVPQKTMSSSDAPIDYSKCSIEELEDVARNIDAERFPERFEEVLRQLARRRLEAPDAPATVSNRVNRLSVWGLTAQSWRILGTNWRMLPVLSMVAAPAGAAIAYFSAALMSAYGSDSFLLRLVVGLSAQALCCAATTIIAVAWHRRVLLSEWSTQPLPRWGGNHLRFWLWLTMMEILYRVGDALVGALAGDEIASVRYAVAVGLGVALWYAWSRSVLVLPAAAVGHAIDLDAAWALSRGNGIRLGTALLGAMAPILIVVIAAFAITGSEVRSEFSWRTSALWIGWTWLNIPALTAIEAGVLGTAYRDLSRRYPSSGHVEEPESRRADTGDDQAPQS